MCAAMTSRRATAAAGLLLLAALALSTSTDAASSASTSSGFAGSKSRDRLRRTREDSPSISSTGASSAARRLSSRYSYVVSLESSGHHVCAGSLITKFAVLTSARCEGKFDTIVVDGHTSDDSEEEEWWISEGNGATLTSSGEVFASFDTAVHPGYKPKTRENDFMVVLLPKPVANEDVLPVELNRYDVMPHELTRLPAENALGYIANEECEEVSGFYPSESDRDIWIQEGYGGKIFDSMLCALEEQDAGECELDLGAPLVVKGNVNSVHLPHDLLFGITSWGGCNDRGFPGVYARARSAESWIDETVCGSDLVSSGVPASFSCAAPNAVSPRMASFEKKLRQSNGIASFTTTGYAEEEKRLYEKLRQINDRESTFEWRQPRQPADEQSAEWPHSLALVITFDDNPDEVAWKFENRRSSNQLAGAAFGDYTKDQAGATLVVPLDILTSEDYEDDWTDDRMREYRFVIWDMNGNGLCCSQGNGKYEIYSKEILVASGASYGAIDEHFFEIDPRTYLDDTGNGGGVPTPANVAPTGPLPVVNIPPPNAMPTPTPPAVAVISTPKPTPPVAPEMPSLMQSFFCGDSFEDAQENCHRPCPTGSPAQCQDMGQLGQDFICYASTTCRERYTTPEPTKGPSPPPSLGPTKIPTPPPTLQPTEPQPTSPPTSPPTASVQPTPAPQIIPNVDSNTWFCGVDWEWFEDHCSEAVPCPRGDATDCPPNMACFASTPCTLSPTISPTSVPSSMPTVAPSESPTKAPFRIEDILIPDFSPGGGNNGGGVQQPTPENTGAGSVLASDVNEALANYSELQYHFFCGISWTHAVNSCRVFCPSGDKNDCPDGEECYANTRCDGRDTLSPTTSPDPNEQGGTSNDGELCSICVEEALVPNEAVMFQGQTTTCKNVQEMVMSENIVADSGTCSNVQAMFGESCCQDECQLCQSLDGNNLLDLKSEHVVQQGEIAATCGEISQVLRKTGADDATCADARTQLGSECCYQQCTLCGDQSEGMSTEWYATVQFQGLTTTCLGLDYMLRAEQIRDGSDLCSQFGETYKDRCCYPSNSCQLCRADETLYGVDEDRVITVEQSSRSTTTTCLAVNDSMAKIDKNDSACTEGKQSFFGQCCKLSNVINSGSPLIDGGEDGQSNNGAGGSKPNASPTTGMPAPSQSAPANGASSANPTTSSPPSSEKQPSSGGQFVTNEPTKPYFWGGPQGTPGNWEENWDPPSGGGYQFRTWSLAKGFLGLSALMFFV